jgi:hypothetical protein
VTPMTKPSLVAVAAMAALLPVALPAREQVR